MDANLAHYITYSMCEQMELLLANYRSELGNALPVTVSREWTEEPTGKLPQIWVDTDMSGDEEETLVGDMMGQDSDGNPLYGAVFDGVRVEFGIRCTKAAECDNLYDYLKLCLRWAVNPATNVQYVQEFFGRRGIEVTGVRGRKPAPVKTSQYGQVYERLGWATVRTCCSVGIVYQPVTSIVVLPQVTLEVPIGL